MKFSKRLRLYLSGFFIGLIFLLFIFGEKLFSWSYLPNDRVLAEIKLKEVTFSSKSDDFLKNKNIGKSYILDTVLVKGTINFKESQAQKEPCPSYSLYYKNMKANFTKCKDSVFIDSLSLK